VKLIVLLVVVFGVLWLARHARRGVQPPPGDKPVGPQAKEVIVACSHCGLHLPRGEALPGRGGLFCSEAHRAAFEQTDRPR
jgi:uncharacterized protein